MLKFGKAMRTQNSIKIAFYITIVLFFHTKYFLFDNIIFSGVGDRL
jgi:hypothetical protein